MKVNFHDIKCIIINVIRIFFANIFIIRMMNNDEIILIICPLHSIFSCLFCLNFLFKFEYSTRMAYIYFLASNKIRTIELFCMRINKLLTHMGSLHEYDLLWTQVHSSILFSWSRVYTSYDHVRQPKMMWALCCFTSIYKHIWWVEHEIKFEMQERRRIITHPSKNLILSNRYFLFLYFLSNLSTIEGTEISLCKHI